jgi:hypothetical protein
MSEASAVEALRFAAPPLTLDGRNLRLQLADLVLSRGEPPR